MHGGSCKHKQPPGLNFYSEFYPHIVSIFITVVNYQSLYICYMNTAALQLQSFEREKNMKASLYTASVMAVLFFLFYFITWVLPQSPPPPVNEGVEVNLGNSDQGLGDIPPLLPGEPSDAPDNNFNPVQTTQANAETETDVAENNEADATPINTSAKPVKNKPVTANNTEVKNTANKPVVQSTPTPPKPKAVYNGGKNTGNGGNNADSYNNSKNQGIAGGNGDQGKPNGNPNSDSYTGNGGKGTGGISISRGLEGRKISSSARFEDEYKYGGKVSVDVTVDENGNVTSAKVKPGSPFADLNAIAVKRAYQLKFNKGDAAQTGTIVIVFENPKG